MEWEKCWEIFRKVESLFELYFWLSVYDFFKFYIVVVIFFFILYRCLVNDFVIIGKLIILVLSCFFYGCVMWVSWIVLDFFFDCFKMCCEMIVFCGEVGEEGLLFCMFVYEMVESG